MEENQTEKHKTSLDDVAREAKAAIADVGERATYAVEKLVDATYDAVDTAGDQVAASGRAAARKIKSAAAKLDAAAHRIGKK